MKGKQSALIPGNEDQVGFWLTSPELLAKLNAEFHFDFDACPFPRPSGFDGLIEDWGSSTYCNPPIGHGYSLSAWIHKAIEENRKGRQIVILLPMTRWFHDLIRAGVEIRELGPTRWLNPKGKYVISNGGGHSPDTLFILRPEG